MAKIRVVAAGSPMHIIIVKEDGNYYQRSTLDVDRLVELDDVGKSTFRAAACAKWGLSRVIGEDGADEPEGDENDALLLGAKTLPDGEHVFQIIERLQPDWDDPLPFQAKAIREARRRRSGEALYRSTRTRSARSAFRRDTRAWIPSASWWRSATKAESQPVFINWNYEKRSAVVALRRSTNHPIQKRRPSMTMPNQDSQRPAVKSGTFTIGADLPVHRLGFGAMQITGPGVWGEPVDRPEAIAVLRRTVELGINLIDTADSYGPYVSEELIRAALHPYPAGLVLATKAGLLRTGPNRWTPLGRPEYLRQECEMSLRRLGVERLDLFQLHRIDPKVPADDQFGLLRDLQNEGKVRHVGLSEVNVAEIEAARRIVPIVTVQNRFNLVDRGSEAVLTYCTREKIGFIPWFPLATGNLAKAGGPLARVAERLGAQPAQVALAWLLKKSPVMLPIPGTSKVKHLEENTAAALVELSAAVVKELE